LGEKSGERYRRKVQKKCDGTKVGGNCRKKGTSVRRWSQEYELVEITQIKARGGGVELETLLNGTTQMISRVVWRTRRETGEIWT